MVEMARKNPGKSSWGRKSKKAKKAKKAKKDLGPKGRKPYWGKPSEPDAIVPRSLVEQAMAFTAPRGRLEMGGLLVGHIDDQGRNVCVAGFFPEQTEETPGYCEFDGSWMAICADAMWRANEHGSNTDPDAPKIRIIGWIHTHPDLGIFLSETDRTTYRANMRSSPDGRFLAVVVDPLRGEDGVFTSPDRSGREDCSKAAGSLEMGATLRERYLSFLEIMEQVRAARGAEALPFIITGDLRREHVSRGYCDDYTEAYLRSIPSIQGSIKSLEDSRGGMITDLGSRINDLHGLLTAEVSRSRELGSSLESRIDGLVTELSLMERSFDERVSALERGASTQEAVIGILESLKDSLVAILGGAIGDLVSGGESEGEMVSHSGTVPEDAPLEA